MEAGGSAYPAVLSFDAPLQVARWRALVNWILAIPHFIVAYALNLVNEVLAVIGWFAIVFTGKLPEGIAGVQCMCMRYQLRASMFAGFLYEPYPPFSFSTTPADPGDLQGLRIDFQPEYEGRNRLTVFFRIIMVIPYLIVLVLLGIAGFVCYLIGFFAVLIMGAWPEGLRAFVVNVMRWGLRLQAYMYLLTDEYPPFQLS
jgi:hypothetical protein